MIDPSLAWMALTAASTFAGGAVAWKFGARRAQLASERAAWVTNRQVVTAREAAERRIRELTAQNAMWTASTLAPRELPAQPVYPDRMAPVEHEALIGMLRGLTLIDDALIADATGFARTREADLTSTATAALAGRVDTLRAALAKVGAGVAEVRVETFDATHVAIRVLTGRAEGSMLVVRSTMRVNPLALDAVAHVAAGGVGDVASPPVPTSWRGTAERRRPADGGLATAFFDDLESELARSKLRAVVFGAHGKASFSAADDGPTDGVRSAVFLAIDMFQAHAARLLHGAGMARVDVTLHGGSVLRWSALAREPAWALVILADDGTTSPALVERLSGRLRRGIDAATVAAISTIDLIHAPQSANGSLR